jgi:hypothetical protein
VTAVSLDRSTGALLIEGKKVFPLVLSNAPPVGGKTPSGSDAFAEIAAGGANFIRAGRPDWSLESLDEQVAAERQVLDAAAANGTPLLAAARQRARSAGEGTRRHRAAADEPRRRAEG